MIGVYKAQKILVVFSIFPFSKYFFNIQNNTYTQFQKSGKIQVL